MGELKRSGLSYVERFIWKSSVDPDLEPQTAPFREPLRF